MFQDMTKMMNESMGPFKDLVSIQTQMFEELSRHQMECTKAFLEATMQQTQAIQKCKTPAELLELQQVYVKELEKTLRSANAQNLKAMQDARAAVEKLATGSLTRFTQSK
ncbi:phasin family protein [Nitrincola tibetensis]|uniref:Phasin family protein n=1 Tax=Nitrincola tibetensis TaxID=2219697 RepID=A0A364NJM6_9GAMM|nr:phasin family protein [Nitrincola tibetensis]RAU17095.1 phasin family protein [Nitrincola tibetensis]